MNERLQELAREAGFYANSIVEKFEKFAKLIIQECADVCESLPLIGPYKEVQDATLKDAAVQIKEHFGVGE